MNDQLLTSAVTVLLAITGIAALAVLVSKNANTSQVLQAGGQAYSTALGAALSPITGGSGSFNFGGGASYLG